MPDQRKIQEPVLVKNPYTGRHVNVAPLFDAMQTFDGPCAGSALNLRQAVSDAIRFVNLSCEEEGTRRKDVNFDLYRLEDMFGAMSEFNQG